MTAIELPILHLHLAMEKSILESCNTYPSGCSIPRIQELQLKDKHESSKTKTDVKSAMPEYLLEFYSDITLGIGNNSRPCVFNDSQVYQVSIEPRHKCNSKANSTIINTQEMLETKTQKKYPCQVQELDECKEIRKTPRMLMQELKRKKTEQDQKFYQIHSRDWQKY